MFFLTDGSPCNSLSTNLQCTEQGAEVQLDSLGPYELGEGKSIQTRSQKKRNYVSQSAVALRCRVMPPPCIKNPYLSRVSSSDLDIFGDSRLKSTGENFLLFHFQVMIWCVSSYYSAPSRICSLFLSLALCLERDNSSYTWGISCLPLVGWFQKALVLAVHPCTCACIYTHIFGAFTYWIWPLIWKKKVGKCNTI